MFRNHIKVAFRYLLNHKSFTIINVFGLTLGFFCFFLLNSYVLKESSFDEGQEGVFRMLQKTTDENGTAHELARAPAKVGSESKLLFDEIENQTQLMYFGRTNIGNDPETITHQDIAIMDDQFLKVFNFPIIEGTYADLTNNPNGIILTESTKELYFGKKKALDKILKVGSDEYPVVGVLADFPENSHLENIVFFSQQMAKEHYGFFNELLNDWRRSQMITYLKLIPDANIDALGDKITTLARDNYPVDRTFSSEYSIQSVQDIHLYENEVEREINKNKGNGMYVRLFFWVGLLILLIACFNYAGLLNIAFIDRSKEIGLRQIVGASKFQLLKQFLVESTLLISVAMLLAYGFLLLGQPLIQNWFSTTLDLTQVPLKGLLIVFLSGLLLATLSVAYPFWTIMRSGKYSSLTSTVNMGSKLPFRRVMLTFQFVAVIVFLTATLVFNQQMDFLKSKELGFQKEGLAMIDVNSGILRNQFQAIKNEFLRIPEVSKVSVSSRVPGEWKRIAQVKATRDGQAITDAKDVLFIGADKDFLETFQVNLVEGTNFMGTASDSTKALVNTTVIKTLGLENPVGKFIEVIDGDDTPFLVQIAGVVEDFQMEDFRTEVKPLIIGNWNNPVQSIDYYTLKIKSSDWATTITALRKVNDAFDPNTPMELNIFDDQFQRFFEQDNEHFKLLNFFSVIVVLIAFMGLFAMSAFVARSRTKEIGIRKVLGSSIHALLILLSKDFVKLMLVGLLIASPISWYLLNEWLVDFAYHVDFEWWVLAVSGLGCLALTLVTVSFQSIKAAIVNPVKSLRSE